MVKIAQHGVIMAQNEVKKGRKYGNINSSFPILLLKIIVSS